MYHYTYSNIYGLKGIRYKKKEPRIGSDLRLNIGKLVALFVFPNTWQTVDCSKDRRFTIDIDAKL